MGVYWVIQGGSTSAAGSVVSLLDNATAITYLAGIAASIVGAPNGIIQFPGNGYLSSTADQVLNVSLSAAFTAGAILVTAWGVEE
jgi:hypothetical protein